MSTHNHIPDDHHDRYDHDRHNRDRFDRGGHSHDRHGHDHPDRHGRLDRCYSSRADAVGALDHLVETGGTTDDAGPADAVAETGDFVAETDDAGPADDADHTGSADSADRARRAGRGSEARSAAPSYPDARSVGQHLVIDKTEWVPGRHPETHLGYDGQRGYAESYYRCIRCGAERQSERDFPPECDWET